jgi:hypothetical protein
MSIAKVPSSCRELPHIKVVVHDYHWRIATSTLAFHLDHGELAVLRRFPRLNSTQVTAHGVEDIRRTTKHARRRGAHLHKVFANGFAERPGGLSELSICKNSTMAHRLNMV